MVGGGPELFPGSLVQAPPHVGAVGLTELAKPLKDEGAALKVRPFIFDHWLPQK